MTGRQIRKALVRAGVLALFASFPLGASAGVLFTDGFGDGDRDNNGLDAGATATDAADVGIPWYLVAGTSAVNFQVVDDSAASAANGNALQLNNTAANNRPSAGHFAATTLNDGDNLTLSFDMRLVSASTTSDRSIRFGLYHDTSNNSAAADQSSTSTVYSDDVGYNARVDDGADASNSTSMDVTRDDSSDTAAILQATTTGLGISSTNSVNQMSDANYHHFVLSLTRSGTGIAISLQKDSNAAITGTDASPTGFTFDEVALGVRSNAAMDLRFDNVQLAYTAAAPEPASLGLLACGAGLLLRRRSRR